MAMGWCKTCDRLVFIKPGPQKWGSRERRWFPVDHDDEKGQPCPGTKRDL